MNDQARLQIDWDFIVEQIVYSLNILSRFVRGLDIDLLRENETYRSSSRSHGGARGGASAPVERDGAPDCGVL